MLRRIGRNIRQLRKADGLSQIDLAVAVDIDRSYLSEIENGHRNPTLMLLQNIATILGVQLEDLLKQPITPADTNAGSAKRGKSGSSTS